MLYNCPFEIRVNAHPSDRLTEQTTDRCCQAEMLWEERASISLLVA